MSNSMVRFTEPQPIKATKDIEAVPEGGGSMDA